MKGDEVVPKFIEKHNYVEWNRRGVVVKRHLPIILKPLIAGLLLMLFWRYVLFPNKIYFQEFATEPIMFIVIPIVAFIYVIFSGIAVTSVFDQYKIISKSVVQKDLDSFLIYRDEQLPILMHILVGAPSIILIISVMLLNYQGHTVIAMATIMAVTFVLLMIWIVATELDDFRRSIWFKEKVPKEWFLIDVEEYFSNKKK